MDPKKRQELKDKATKGMKFTHEGTSYGLYKGSGKPSGAMRKYLDNAKKMQQADKKKKKTGNPAFDDPSHHSNAKSRNEEYINEVKRSRKNPGGYTKDQIDANRENLKKNIMNIPSNIKKIPGKIKEVHGKVIDSVKNKVVDSVKNKVSDITGGIKDTITQTGSRATGAVTDAIKDAGKVVGSNVGKGLIGGAAILETAALASKALEKRKEKKEKEKVKSEQMSFQQFQEKCWAGYEKKGMKTMFGKRYPNCVKKKK